MAVFRASRWADGMLGATYNNLIGRLDDAMDAIVEYTQIDDAVLLSATDNVIRIGIVPSGAMELRGSGFSGLASGFASSVTINQLGLSLPTFSLSLVGNMIISETRSGFSAAGSINQVSLQAPGASLTYVGDYRLASDGSVTAFNATETLRLTDGSTLVARTNSAAQYASFDFAGGGVTFSATGPWAYDSISSVDDLFRDNDTLIGSAGRDFMSGGRGNDRLEGGAGVDTAVFSGTASSFAMSRSGSAWVVSNASFGADTLVDMERVRFSNKTIALDVDGTAGQVYRLYRAAFDRAPDLPGLRHWVAVMDNGMSLETVAQQFIASPEFAALYGNNAPTARYVTLLYNNALDRDPDAAGYQHWLSHLDARILSREQVLLGFSESAENKAALVGVIGNGIDLGVV